MEVEQQKFLEKFEEYLEIKEGTILLTTEFKSLSEWDSLGLLTLMSMLEDEYNTQINRKQLDEINTILELFNLTK